MVFAALNTYVINTNKSLNNTYIAGLDVGGLDSEQIIQKMNKQLASKELTLRLGDQELKTPIANMGLTADDEAIKDLTTKRSFNDLFRPWFVTRILPLPVQTDTQKANNQLVQFKQADFTAAQNATFSIASDQVVVADGKNGFGLDTRRVLSGLETRINKKIDNVTYKLKPQKLSPEITKSDIEKQIPQILAIVSTDYSIIYGKEKVIISKADLADWLILSKSKSSDITISASKDKINAYVSKLADSQRVNPINQVTTSFRSGKVAQVTIIGKNGREVSNINAVADSIYDKFSKKDPLSSTFDFRELSYKKLTATIDDTNIKAVYTYEVVAWGNIKADFNEFKVQAAETLTSILGWRAGGVVFQQVASGGNMTLVLAEPSRVDSAASYCDAFYSCRVGRYAIINEDRWLGATSSWNNGGGSLRDYRHMVVNHEVGHWLGYGHKYCGGAGQKAPVMQQQSINLRGCTVNPWPLRSEL